MAWLPSTAVGDGDEPPGEGGAELGPEVAVAAAGVADPGVAGGDTEGEVLVALGGALCATVAEGLADPADALGLA